MRVTLCVLTVLLGLSFLTGCYVEPAYHGGWHEYHHSGWRN